MQLINFTMLAPSGSGGAFLTELLDNNWSKNNTRINDNYRCKKTNEYAGSSNIVRLEYLSPDYEFNDKSILLGKGIISPLNLFQTSIKCDKTYVIDIEGHEELLKDLIFLKKIIGSSWEHSTPYELKHSFKSNGNIIKRSEMQSQITWDKFKKLCSKMSDLICPTSVTAIAYYLRHEPEEKTFRNWISREYEKFVINNSLFKPISKQMIEEIKPYTEIDIIKYEDMVKGKVPFHKQKIKQYMKRNTDLLDRMFLDFDIC
tara:strand:+ start:60 stop:836 length:777 start_codon:yes stop_codon:yes gene_type:complete